MATATITPRERLEAAVKAVDASQDVLNAKGAAATDEDHATATRDADEMRSAAMALQTAADRGDADALLADQAAVANGKTFDDHASSSGIINPAPGMTLGEAFAASPAYEQLLTQSTRADGSVMEGIGKSQAVDLGVAVAGFRNDYRFGSDDGSPSNNLVTGGDKASAGALVTPNRIPGLFDPSEFRRRVWDLFTTRKMTSDLLEYVEVDVKTNNADFVAEATSSDEVDGTTVTDVIGGVKPRSELTLIERSQKVETVAHWIPVTRRAAADAPQIINILNTFMVSGVNARAERGLLLGSGTSPEIRGLLNTTNPYALNAFSLAANGNPTRLDALASAAAAILSEGAAGEVFDFDPDTVLINPLDWFSGEFQLAKDANGAYLGAGPFGASLASMNVWGLRPVLTKFVPQGTQVVGDFRHGIIGDRQQASLYFTDSHTDFFVRNILTILAEMRFAFGVQAPKAFTVITA